MRDVDFYWIYILYYFYRYDKDILFKMLSKLDKFFVNMIID